MGRYTTIYAKLGTGPGLHWRCDIQVPPTVGQVFEMYSLPVRHGEKPILARCTDTRDMGDGRTLYLLEMP